MLTIDIIVFNLILPCDQEYLRIHDGPTESSEILVEYCLNRSRDDFRVYQLLSSGRSLWIETKKGINNSTSLFRVSYKAMDFEGKEKDFYTCVVICMSTSPKNEILVSFRADLDRTTLPSPCDSLA